MQSRNRNRNRVLDMDSLGTGTGTGFQDWTVSEPESESKKLEPGTSEPDASLHDEILELTTVFHKNKASLFVISCNHGNSARSSAYR